jgi:hypothetical protein
MYFCPGVCFIIRAKKELGRTLESVSYFFTLWKGNLSLRKVIRAAIKCYYDSI